MNTEKNQTLKLKNVRGSFLHIFDPKVNKEDPTKAPKFEATFILDKVANAAEIQAVQNAVEACKKSPVLKGKKISKCCLRDGADTESRAATDGFGPTVMTVSARNTKRQYVVDRDGKTLLTAQDNKCLGGDYLNVVVEIYPFVHKTGGPMVCASLGNVQFVREGKRFGAAPRSPEMDFTPETDDESAVG